MAKKKKEIVEKKASDLLDTEFKEIEFTCPIRGKVKQKVKVKVYRSNTPSSLKNEVNTKDGVLADSGLSGLLGSEEDMEDFHEVE